MEISTLDIITTMLALIKFFLVIASFLTQTTRSSAKGAAASGKSKRSATAAHCVTNFDIMTETK